MAEAGSWLARHWRRVSLIGGGVWAASVLIIAVLAWPDDMDEALRERDDGIAFCRQRYSEADRQERCIDLFEVQYGSRFRGSFVTIGLIALGPPLAAFGLGFALNAASARPTGRRGPRR